MLDNQTNKIKHIQLREYIRQRIVDGTYPDGAQIPTEIEISEQFSVSRPTVARALTDLQREGLVERIAGSGTFVRLNRTSDNTTGMIGLIIPGLGKNTVFDPICRQLSILAENRNYTLFLGGIDQQKFATDPNTYVEQLCQRYIDQAVKGVFFAPLEFPPDMPEMNTRILSHLTNFQIPVVLLDRDCCDYPQRSPYDLVAVDNFKAGYVLARHLIETGSKRIEFVFHPESAETVKRRVSGYIAALVEAGLQYQPDWVHVGDYKDSGFLSSWYAQETEAIICANDGTATSVLGIFREMGVKVPHDVRLCGVDDLNYVQYLNPPLTTMRQPCQALAHVALDTMMSRIQDPTLPPRTIELDCDLMVRESSLRPMQRA